MINNMKNLLIRFLGFYKRFLRQLNVYINHNKTKFRYTLIGVSALSLIAVIIVLISGETLDLSNFTNPAPTVIIQITPTLPIATATPIKHIYGDVPLVILECITFNDNDYIAKAAYEFGVQNDIEGSYTRVERNKFISTYNEMVKNENKPNVIIAPNDIIMKLGNFEDISSINDEILFNNAAKGAVKNDKIPIALAMYGYFFRVDLLYLLSFDIPHTYNDIKSLSEQMRSDNAYKYLSYKEKDKLKSEKKDEFNTSRYGFGFSGGDVGGGLFISQAIMETYEDGTNILDDVKYMWDELYLPPDTIYSTDDNMIKAYLNDALCAVFAPATLYEELFNDSELYYGTQIKPYIGSTPTYMANVIYCAIPEGSNIDVGTNFLSKLYNGGNVDKIIVQNHMAYLPISLFYNQASPWIGALNESTEVIFYENDVYLTILKHIILAGEDVETAIKKSKN